MQFSSLIDYRFYLYLLLLLLAGGEHGGGVPRLKSNLNKVMLIGTVGQNPKAINFANGKKVTFSVATSDTYRFVPLFSS